MAEQNGVATAKEQLFTIGGESWTLVWLNQGMKTAFSNWVTVRLREAAIDSEMALQRRARVLRQQLIDDSRASAMDGGSAILTEQQREEYTADVEYLLESAARQLKDFNEAKATGKLHFTGELCIETMRSTEGTIKMMQLVLTPKHPGMSFEQLTDVYSKNKNAWVDAIREVAGLGKKPAIPFGTPAATPQETP